MGPLSSNIILVETFQPCSPEVLKQISSNNKNLNRVLTEITRFEKVLESLPFPVLMKLLDDNSQLQSRIRLLVFEHKKGVEEKNEEKLLNFTEMFKLQIHLSSFYEKITLIIDRQIEEIKKINELTV